MSPTPIRDPNAPPDPAELRDIPDHQRPPGGWLGHRDNPVPPGDHPPTYPADPPTNWPDGWPWPPTGDAPPGWPDSAPWPPTWRPGAGWPDVGPPDGWPSWAPWPPDLGEGPQSDKKPKDKEDDDKPVKKK